jgi:hypothetical protein
MLIFNAYKHLISIETFTNIKLFYELACVSLIS